MDIFLSVGSTATPHQEAFVRAIEERLRAEGLNPQTVGRNYFTADSPFTGVNKLMDTCKGVVVVALERLFIETGTEKRGSALSGVLSGVKLATPWNQVEAALGYARKLPLLVIVEDGIRQDGLLEKGFDWYVISMALDPSGLTTLEFNGVLSSWKAKVISAPTKPSAKLAASEATIAELLGGLKPAQFWAALAASATALGGAFALGAKLFP
jgi:hypothetical protein